jgi:hypothetical protein
VASNAILVGSGTEVGASIAAKNGAFEQSPVPQNKSKLLNSVLNSVVAISS